MPKGKGTYGSKKGRPPMEYGKVKKPKMTGKKDYKRKQTREEIAERERRIQERLHEDAKKRAGAKPQMNKPMKFEDQKGTGPGITKADKIAVAQNGYNPKLYKPQMNKGPYMMKPGRESATRNTPGPFRAEVPYMYEATKPMMFKGQVKKVLDTVDPNRFRRAEARRNNQAKIAKKRAELKAGYGNKVKK